MFKFSLLLLEVLRYWVHSKVGFEPLPEGVILVGFSFTFSKDVINQVFPEAHGLLAEQKGASVSQTQDYHLLQEAGMKPGEFSLALHHCVCGKSLREL